MFLRKGHPNITFWIKISNKLFHWLQYSHLKANPGKFHLLLSSVHASLITSTEKTLLRVSIDLQLSFDQHAYFICSKASKKLHALGLIATFMSFKNPRTLNESIYRVPIQLFSPNMDASLKNNK